jgi:hypothetical protein
MGRMGEMGWMDRLPETVIPAQAGIHEGSPMVIHHALGPHGLLLSQE